MLQTSRTIRRTVLGSLIAASALFSAQAYAASVPDDPDMKVARDEPAQIIGEWQTDNGRLRPFTCTADSLYLSGDTTAEMWDFDGNRKWSTKLPGDTAFRIRVGEGIAFASGRKNGFAMDAQTGEMLWEIHAPEGQQLSVPVLGNGKVFVGVDSWLKAIDARTGEELWEFQITLPRRIGYGPTYYDSKENGPMVIVGPGDGNLYGIDAETGDLIYNNDQDKKQWQYLRQLYVAEGTDMLVAGGYRDDVYGIDADTGETRWRMYAGNFVNSHMVIDQEAYFWSPTGWIYSLNTENGKVWWRHLTDDHSKSSGRKKWGHFMAELVGEGRYVYALDMKNVLHLLDRGTGDEVRAYQLPFKARFFTCVPKGSFGSAFVGTNDGKIVKLKIEAPK